MAVDIYQWLGDRSGDTAFIEKILLGLSWSTASLRFPSGETNSGLCFSPTATPRNIPWPGTLVGRTSNELIKWIESDEPASVVVGLAVLNALINRSDNPLLRAAKPLQFQLAPHLAVFEHFADQLAGASVAVIGRYPGLDTFKSRFDFVCLERRPGPDDLPAEAAPSVLPQVDWVFITASSIANKTLPQLLALSGNATVVLMGPSMPWLGEWAEFGVDYLAGVEVVDAPLLDCIVSEAGGTRIFEQAVRYRLLALG